MNMGRIAAMAAGFPKEVAGATVNRFCSSGSQAIMMAAQRIQEGADVAIGAGVETITMMTDGTQNTTRMVNKAAQERFPGLYFTGTDEPYEKRKRALRAEIDEAAWSELYSTTSRPFDPPESGKIAVKVINHYGDEVLKVYEIC